MGQELIIAAIQTVGTLASVGLAAYFVVNQIKLGERLKLKLDIYKEILKVASSAQDAYSEVAHKVNLFQYSFIPIWLNKKDFPGYEPKPPTDAITMINLNAEAGYKAVEVLTLIENWTVIDPRVRVFHTAVNVALHEMRTAWRELEPYLFRSAAMFQGEPIPTRVHPGHKENWVGFAEALRIYSEGVSLLDCYIADLRTEMQNELIGGLFKTRSPTRVPIDPKYRPVTLRDSHRMEAYFLQSTPWGAEMKRVNIDTAAALKNANIEKLLA